MDWWDAVGAPARRALHAVAVRQRYAAGTSIFLQGDPATGVVVVECGEVKVTRVSPSGREVVLAVRGPGDLIGLTAVLDGGVRMASIEALSDVRAFWISGRDLNDVRARFADVDRALIVILVEQQKRSDDLAYDIGTKDAVARICTRLLEFAEGVGGVRSAAHCSRSFELPVAQRDLAASVGLSREAAARAMASLRQLGWIRTDGRVVTLADVAAIRQRSAGAAV